MFMTFDDQQVVTAELAPGGRFVSEAEWGQSGGFMFTACPVGYKPSVPLLGREQGRDRPQPLQLRRRQAEFVTISALRTASSSSLMT